MADYLHGAYGTTQVSANRVATKSKSAIVYIGTAPVHTVEGGGANVHKPILVSNIAEARRKLGYSDDFASYTLCEAMKVHLSDNGIGPIVFINVFDPAVHKKENKGTKTLTPENGRVLITGAQEIVLDSVTVKQGENAKVKGVDYFAVYSTEKKTITIAEITSGALGTEALTISYDEVDPSKVSASDAIGSTDGLGTNTGIYALRNVYPITGYIPSFVLAPGFGSIPEFHSALASATQKIGGHWDAYMLIDLPITLNSTPVTLANVVQIKNSNGYNCINETVYYPMVMGTDGKKYHLSVLAAANFQILTAEMGGIPFRTASNTACSAIENLYLGAVTGEKVYDEELINEMLNKHGIASAAYVGGRWAIWGAHSADYNQSNVGYINVAETNRMMLYYLSNDFQHRRTFDIDSPMTANGVKAIIAEEQARLDGLISAGALISGSVTLNVEADAMSDIMVGDFSFAFNITTTPLAKSMTAIVTWTEDGFETYYEMFKQEA